MSMNTETIDLVQLGIDLLDELVLSGYDIYGLPIAYRTGEGGRRGYLYINLEALTGWGRIFQIAEEIPRGWGTIFPHQEMTNQVNGYFRKYPVVVRLAQHLVYELRQARKQREEPEEPEEETP